MITDKQKEFLTKLHALLEEYDAMITIDAASCSDWHGIVDERVAVLFGEGKAVNVCNVCDGITLSAYDIYNKLKSEEYNKHKENGKEN